MGPEVHTESRAGRLEAINASWAYDDLINDVLHRHRVDVQHLLQPPRISITRAPHHDDVRKATDYLGTLQRSGLRLAVRVRSFGHLGRYGGEFVMRDNAPDGTPTEADKILTDSTSANLYLYAFTDIVGNRFAQYLLVDLIRLRAIWADDVQRGQLQPRHIRFSSTESGLMMGVDRLRAADCVVGAAMAVRTLTSQAQAREALQSFDAYVAMDERQRSRAEILLMKTLFHQAELIGGSAS